MAMGEIRAGKAYIEIGTKNTGLDAGFLSARRHLGSFVDSVRAAELKMRNFSVSARNLGLDLIKLGVVIGTPIAFGVKQFADFEKEMARVSTFLKNPQELMPKFRAEILKLSDEFGIAATEMATGLAEILSANIPAADSFEYLKQAMKGSVGNAVEFKDQLSGLITFMQAYEGSGMTAARATELLRVAVEEGRIPANDLANTMGMVASKMAQAGGSAEELIATYSALSTTGLSVSEQTTMFRGILTAFSDASPETAKEFQRLSKAVTGVAQPMTLANLKTQGFTKTLEWLTKLSPDDLGKIFKDVRASNGIIVLSSKMELFKKSLDAARGRAGLADKAFETMTDTLTHLGEKIVTTGKNLAIQFGEVLLGTLKEVGNALIEIGNIVSAFIKKNPQLAITLTKIAVVAATVGGVLLGLGLAFSILSTALSGFVAIGNIIVGVMSSIFGIIGSMVGFLFSWAGAIVAFGIILTSTFIDFGKVFDYVKTNIKTGINSLQGVFSSFKESIGRTFAAVKDAVAAKNYDLAVKIIVNEIKLLWFKAVDEVTKKYNDLKDKFVTKFSEIKAFLGDWLSGTLNTLSDLTGWSLFSDMSALFGDAFQDMDGTLKGFAKTWIRVWAAMQEFALTAIRIVNDGWKDIQIAHYQDVLSSWGKTEGDIADARQKVAEMIGGDKNAMKVVNDLMKTSENIERLQGLLEKGVNADRKKGIEDQIKEDLEVLSKTKAALTSKIGVFSKNSFMKNFETAFNPRPTDVVEATNKLSDLERNKQIFKLDIDEAIKKISNMMNEKIIKQDLGGLTSEQQRLDKLNKGWGNTPFADRKISNLEKEKTDLEKQSEVSLFGKKLADTVMDLNNQFGNFWEKTFGGDSKVLGGNPDISAIEIEKQKIRDGVLGAFNTNALGNYGAGDVMKSVKELLEEAARRDLERKGMLDEDLKLQKKIEQNTKQQFKFSGGI